MARLPRVTQKIFAESSPANQVTTFGSIKAGTPVYSKSASDIMNANFEGGWSYAVEDDYAPYRQDRNAVDTATTQQLAYLFQDGVAEYDSNTTYYKGSICKVISGTAVTLYKSIADSNTSAVTDTTKWQKLLEMDANGKIVSPTITTPTIEGGSMSNGSFANPTFTGTVNVPLASASSSTSDTTAACLGWVNDPTLSSNVVHKTGTEAISGAKTFSDTVKSSTMNNACFIHQRNVTKGTAPSSQILSRWRCTDTIDIGNNHTIGGMEVAYNTDGSIATKIQAFKPEYNSVTSAFVEVVYPSSGNPYSTAPTPTETTSTAGIQIATTGWVNTVGNNVAHLSGDETIAGNKTFSNEIKATLASYVAYNGSSNTNKYKKIGSIVMTGSNATAVVPFIYTRANQDLSSGSYLGKISLRTGSTAGTLNYSSSGVVLTDMPNFISDGLAAFYIAYKENTPSSGKVTCEFWVYVQNTYYGINITPLRQMTGGGNYSTTDWTWYDNPTGSTDLPSDYTTKAQVLLENTALSSDGYCKLSNGLIIQWGQTASGSSTTVTFPTAFTSTNYVVSVGLETASGENYAAGYDTKTTTGFKIHTYSGAASRSKSWIAIGY